jgi:hypothetical protein
MRIVDVLACSSHPSVTLQQVPNGTKPYRNINGITLSIGNNTDGKNINPHSDISGWGFIIMLVSRG